MLNRIYEKTKKYIKENAIFLIIIITTYIIINIPLPYVIYTTGGLIDINNKVKINTNNDIKGSFNLSYVSEIKGNIITCLISFIIPNWELININEIKTNNENMNDVTYRNKMFLQESNDNAVIVAFNKANKPININKTNHYIVYIDEIANTTLKIKDEIIEVDGKTINNVDDYTKIINEHNIGDQITIKTNNGDKTIKVVEYDNKKLTGIYFITLYDYNTKPDVKFNFGSNESGPSGGLMITLSIYTKIIDKDITNGKKIVGTGTIDIYGNIGEIDGIKHKLKGAVKNKADIFFTPSGNNYKEAIKEKEQNNYDIEIIEVSTIDDAINYLENR